MNKTLMTDFYELTMAQTYFNEGKKDQQVYFDIFFRKNPFDGGYTMSGGLEETIEFIKNFKFGEEEIDYLKKLGIFNEQFLSYLKNLKFKGDVYAVPDGTAVFPNEPVLTVKADIITAQLLETALLANFNHGSLVTTAAKRITNEAGNIPVMEFGARRARGIDSAIEASKHAYVGGCVGTSNTYAGMKYNIPVLGTMAHSLVTDCEDEYDAFLEYAKSNPDNCLFLVDTYDTLRSGIPNAIKTFDYMKEHNMNTNNIGIRIDSGDLAYLSKETRKMLDEAGFPQAKICLSNGLTAETIETLINQGAKFDSLGVGDNISKPEGRMGCVYKEVALNTNGTWEPKIKLSNDTIKIVNPGYKKLYRAYDEQTGYAIADVMSLYDKEIDKRNLKVVSVTDYLKQTTIDNFELVELQKPIFENGELVYNDPELLEKQTYCNEQMSTLYQEVKRTNMPAEYYVDGTDDYVNFKKDLIVKTRNLVK